MSFHGRTVQLAVLRGNGEFAPPIAVSSRSRLTQLLEKSFAGEEPGQVPSPAVLDDLLSVIPKLGTKGGSLLLVGELPTLDAATTGFASALLIKASTAQELLLDILSPTPLGEEWSPLFRSLSSESTRAADSSTCSEPKDQDIWFLQGETANRVPDTELAKHSYEEGLSLGGVHVTAAIALLRLYVTSKETDKANAFATTQLSTLPQESEPRLQFATTLDELQMNKLALQGWRRLLEVQPGSEHARTRVARLLLDSGDAAGAKGEAETGLSTIPNSAPLYAVKAEAEEKLGRTYDARRTLQEGLNAIPDPALAKQLAELEEQFSGGAPTAYGRLADLLPPSSPERIHALERGFETAVRDGDLKQAEKFASLLEASGQKEYRASLGGEKVKTSQTTISGGLSSLAFAAHASKQDIPPDRFLLEYSRTALMNAGDNEKKYQEGLHEYFEQIAALRALGTATPEGVVIPLSLTDKAARRQTEKALNILGVRLKNAKGAVEVTQGEKKSQALRQETASAIALDEIGIQEALQAGKTYRLLIRDEPASVYPSEQAWRDALGLKNYGPGGFAEELVRVPHMARLYVSLNSMDRSAADELIKAMPLRDLIEHESDLLYYYAPALVLEGTHVSVPGGSKAESIWKNLVARVPLLRLRFSEHC